jgi:hypothetical protein
LDGGKAEGFGVFVRQIQANASIDAQDVGDENFCSRAS